jgi:hypothetical protein
MSRRKLWDKDAVRQAIRAVKKKEVGLLKAVKGFNVPRSTLIDYVKTNDTDIEKLLYSPDIFKQSDFLANARDQEAASEEDNINQGPLVSPGDIVPVPRINEPVPSTSHRGRHRGSAALLTSSPYKSTLTESERKNELSAKRKLISSPVNQSKCAKAASNKKFMKRNKHDSTSRSSNEDPSYVSTDDSDSESGDEAQYPFCHGLFCNDNKGETWIRCIKCFQWAHEKCGKGRNKAPKYICISCLNS